MGQNISHAGDGLAAAHTHYHPENADKDDTSRCGKVDTIVEGVKEMHLMELASLVHIYEQPQPGDALVFVDFKEGIRPVICSRLPFSSVCFFMPVETLRSLGSETIDRMLSDKAQERLLRRFSARSELTTAISAGVQYFLDFTPAPEGDDLAGFLADLCLPKGISCWYAAAQYMPDRCISSGPFSAMPDTRVDAYRQVPPSLVSGHDELCPCNGEDSWDIVNICNISCALDPARPFRDNMPEYCEVRHRINIVRLLFFLKGSGNTSSRRDLLINSAPRMWTLVHIAHHLDVTDAITKNVLEWFLHRPNSKFVEVLPEASFRIGWIMKLEDILIASFKILVNEMAIDFAASGAFTRSATTGRSFSGRHRADTGERGSDALQYASQALAERFKATLDRLRSPGVFDSFGISEWQRVKFMVCQLNGQPGETVARLQNAWVEMHKGLLEQWRQRVTDALADVGTESPSRLVIEAQRRHYIGEHEFVPMPAIVGDLNDYQKIMLPFFWLSLRISASRSSAKKGPSKTMVQLVAEFNEAVAAAVSENLIGIDHRSLELMFGSRSRSFNLYAFRDDLDLVVGDLCNSMLDRSDHTKFTFLLSDHLLLNLEHSELRYLPDWTVLGQDDGSGAVFQAEIPPSTMGPSGPGPAYHTGLTVGTDDEASTDAVTDLARDLEYMSVDDDSDADTVGHRSVDARHGTSGQLDSSGPTTESEAFTEDRDGRDYVEAMFREPADHQIQGEVVLELAREKTDEEKSESSVSLPTPSGSEQASVDDGASTDSEAFSLV